MHLLENACFITVGGKALQGETAGEPHNIGKGKQQQQRIPRSGWASGSSVDLGAKTVQLLASVCVLGIEGVKARTESVIGRQANTCPSVLFHMPVFVHGQHQQLTASALVCL